jgi:hypothetical protein
MRLERYAGVYGVIDAELTVTSLRITSITSGVKSRTETVLNEPLIAHGQGCLLTKDVEWAEFKEPYRWPDVASEGVDWMRERKERTLTSFDTGVIAKNSSNIPSGCSGAS